MPKKYRGIEQFILPSMRDDVCDLALLLLAAASEEHKAGMEIVGSSSPASGSSGGDAETRAGQLSGAMTLITHQHEVPQLRETRSVPPMPSACAAPVDRSIQRPFTKGPRSLIRTVTLRPLFWDVTVTREPNERVR